MKYSVFLLVLFFLTPLNSKQQFYKWTDSDGNIHYSKNKPIDQNSSDIKINNFQPDTIVLTEDEKQQEEESEQQTYKEKIEYYREKKAKEKEKSIKAKKDCQSAKNLIAKFSQKVRYSGKNKKTGEYTYLEDDDRAKILKESKKFIKKNCR